MENQSDLSINIYTDGACSGNQFENNSGGWGAILEYGDYTKEIHGGELNTTNNRMEMTALIESLSALTKKNYDVNVFSDSSYLIDCLRKRWYEKWQSNGWRKADKKPVENKELWEKLLGFLSYYEFRFYLIKGHVSKGAREETLRGSYDRFVKNNGEAYSYEEFLEILERNRRADELATLGAAEARE